MTRETNKTKKKRKNSDEGLENTVKKGKRYDEEISAVFPSLEMKDREKSEDIQHRDSQSNKKEKKRKKKRKGEEFDENSIIEKKPKVNGASQTSNAQNGETIDSNIPAHPRSEVADGSGDEENEKAKVSREEARQWTGRSLRKSFNSQEGLETLRKFLIICKDNEEFDLAAEYLQAGGSVLEILRLLDSSDKKNLNNASVVFAAMRLIIIKILSHYPQHRSNAEEACRHFINSHLSFVHGMLSAQSNAKHRKIVLRLLASMVSLGGTLPRELLAHLSFHSQVLDTLAQQTKPSDSQSVRTCFIHFVLAYLIDGKASTIRALLDKRGMLSSIFPELLYDSHTTVHLVLETVKKWILENSSISKTTKLHVFSTPVLQSLVSLYNWKGPKNWPGPKGKKREARNDIVDPEEKEIAVEAVHDFLKTLLTSNRHGVIFHDRSLGTSGRKYNQLVNTVLQSLDRPWEHSRPLDLVIKVLTACPDLVRSQLTYTEPFLEPRPSKKWILAMRFVGKLIDSHDPKNSLKPCLSVLSSAQLVKAVESLAIPQIILKNSISPSLENEENIIRHEAVVLLTRMLKKTRAFGKIIDDNCHEIDRNYYNNAMTDYIGKNVPRVETILKIWQVALEPEITSNDEIEEYATSRSDHFTAILDLLDAYREICPEISDLSAPDDDRTEILLKGLENLTEMENDDFSRTRVKAVKFFLSVDPAAFDPKKKLFGRSLSFLMRLLGPDESEIRAEARRAIIMLLGTSGLFEGCSEQIDIWIEGFARLENEKKIDVADWLVKIIGKTMNKIPKYLDVLVNAEESAGDEILNADRLDDIFNDLAARNFQDFSSTKISSPTSISPIVCCAIDSLKKNHNEIIAEYLSYVLTLTLHCQNAPGTLIRLSREIDDFPAKKYLNSWLNDEKPTSACDVCCGGKLVKKLSKIMAKNAEFRIDEILHGNNNVEFYYRDENIVVSHDLRFYDVAVLLRMSIFYLTQFIAREKLSREQFRSYEFFIIGLLHIAKNISGDNDDFVEKSSRIVVAHPTFLRFFSPFRKSEMIVEKIVTSGLVDIFRNVASLNDEEIRDYLFAPFRKKFISRLISAVRNNDEEKRDEASSLMEYLDILRPTSRDVENLLGEIMEFPVKKFLVEKTEFSIWGNIVPKLMELLANEKRDCAGNFVDGTFVKKIISRLIQLKNYRRNLIASWESSLQLYLENHPRNIAGVDGHAFNSLLKLAKSDATMSLLSFLVGRSDQYVSLFVNFAMQNQPIVAQCDVIFPLIAKRSTYEWSVKFLAKIHSHHRNDVEKYFAEPENAKAWISRDVKATILLIDSCFEIDECKKACDIVLSNGEKLDDVDINYAKLVETLFKKMSKLDNNSLIPLTNFVQILIRITVTALKKDSKNEEKLVWLGKTFAETINRLKSIDRHFLFEDLNRNLFWRQFVRFTLAHGLKASKDDEKESTMLRMLVSACDVAYKDAGEHEYVKTLFEMTTNHSKFINIMLGSQSIKRDLLQLLWILVRKNHSIMSSSQIPLYLAAYNATLAESDQFILLILQHYEANGIKFNDYRPYLWGEAAATHYSVKGEADTALWRQPSTSQVLDLFNPEIIKNTIKHFPVHRDLKPSAIDEAEKIYDPAFYLPLLSYLLSDNNVVACHRVTQSGALALVFAASGSSRPEIRLAAYTVISRFYFHLEATSSKEKHLWIRMIDALRNGIIDMNSILKDVKTSCIVSTFLARASLVTTQPSNHLYSPIQGFFMAKPALDLNTILEFLQLFHSSDIEHLSHRHWILGVIRDGMRTDFDTDIALKCVVFKIFLDFFSSVLADPMSKRLILQIIESTVKIPKTGLLVIRSYGILPWINEISANLSSRDEEIIDIILSIIRETLIAVARTKGQDKESHFFSFNVLLNVKPCLSKNTSAKSYNAYVESLSEIIRTKAFRAALTKDDLRQLIKLAGEIYGDVDHVEETLNSDGQYSLTSEPRKSLDDEFTRGRESLRRLILTWCGHGTRL